MEKKHLNLGCGNRYHKEWTNIDFISNSEHVIECNLLNGIPFSDNEFDFVYTSHVLEHFSKKDGSFIIQECYRVLKKGGILRIIVPDLEQLALEYIKSLNSVLKDKSLINDANYKWSVIELIDQLVREESGGEMLKYWSQKEIINESKVIDRSGDEYVKARKSILSTKINTNVLEEVTWRSKIKSFLFSKLRINAKNLEIGNFVNGGEVHKWMYDRYSLSILLNESKFIESKIQSSETSYLINWNEYLYLDVENGKTRKPDSIIIEAIK